MGKTLTLHSGGNWAGAMPSFADLTHECGDNIASYLYESTNEAAFEPVDGVPAGPIVSAAGFQIRNLTALGHNARPVPLSGTGSGVYNSDLAFKDNLVYQGTYEGFRVLDVTNKSNPVQIANVTGCNVGQGDVIVHGNILVRSWDQGASSSSTCGGQLVGSGFEGIHIFNIADPANPVFVRGMRFASNNPGLNGCGSHTATAVPDPARDALYIYNGGSSSACEGIDIFKIKISDPTQAEIIGRATNEGIDRNTGVARTGNNSCHDNNVLMNVGGTTTGYAMCAGGNGLTMYKFDMAKKVAGQDGPGTPAEEGSVEKPTQLWTMAVPGVGIGHSGSFTYDGKVLIFGHEPGGGSDSQCQASSSLVNRSLYFIAPETGEILTTKPHERHQSVRENCTWHNFNVIPSKAGYYATVGSYQSGISILDFSGALDKLTPTEIAFADPAPLQLDPPTQSIVLGGDWSTYWHNGYIYESDIKRGITTWQLNLPAAFAKQRDHLARTNTRAESNPQTQTGSFAADNAGPTVTVASPVEGSAHKVGSTYEADFACADDSGVESCVGTVEDGATVSNSALGPKVFRVTAMDTAGNVTTKDVAYKVNSVDFNVNVNNSVPVESVMSLTLPTSVNFGAFIPGATKSYESAVTATITSSAGDTTLSVYDPSSTATGRLVNGTRALNTPLSINMASGTQATALAGGAVGGASAPTQILSYSAPQTNRNSTLWFRQQIASNEVLQAGTYGKTLTFTLSSNTP